MVTAMVAISVLKMVPRRAEIIDASCLDDKPVSGA
jgi:hypothetical protein